MASRIAYSDGWKYQLRDDVCVSTLLFPEKEVRTEYIDMNFSGSLTIRKGYAWDGPSGPTIDTKNFMRGSLVHDALYQLIRGGHLPKEARNHADRLLQQLCVADGMWKIRAWWVYQGVSKFGEKFVGPAGEHKTIYAP